MNRYLLYLLTLTLLACTTPQHQPQPQETPSALPTILNPSPLTHPPIPTTTPQIPTATSPIPTATSTATALPDAIVTQPILQPPTSQLIPTEIPQTSPLPPLSGQIVFLWDPNPIPAEQGQGQLIVNNLYTLPLNSESEQWEINLIQEFIGEVTIFPSPDANKLTIIHSDITIPTYATYLLSLNDFLSQEIPSSQPLLALHPRWMSNTAITIAQGPSIFTAQLNNLTSQLLLLELSGYVVQHLWSPDGKFLAILHARSDTPTVYTQSTQLDLFRVQTQELLTLIPAMDSEAKLGWSADSQWLMVESNEQGLLTINSNNYLQIPLLPKGMSTFASTFAEWSPITPQLAFTEESHLFLWDGDLLTVNEVTGWDWVNGPVWSPDGKTIATGYWKGDESGLLLIDSATGTETNFNFGMIIDPIAWEPNNEWLLFSATQNEKNGLYLVHRSGILPFHLLLETTGRNWPHDIFWLPTHQQ